MYAEINRLTAVEGVQLVLALISNFFLLMNSKHPYLLAHLEKISNLKQA